MSFRVVDAWSACFTCGRLGDLEVVVLQGGKALLRAGGAVGGLLTRGDVDSADDQGQGKASENPPLIFLRGRRSVDGRSESATGAVFILRGRTLALAFFAGLGGERTFSCQLECCRLAGLDTGGDFDVGVGLSGKRRRF